MEYSEKVDWLRRYRQLVKQQELLELELQRVKSDSERVSCLFGGTTFHSADCDRIPRSVELIMEREEKLQANIAALVACQTDIQKAISKVESPILQTILIARYIVGLTSEQTAQRCNISARWERELHRRAICMILRTRTYM